VSGSRAVRIPRDRATPGPGPAAAAQRAPTIRPNRGGRERSIRIAAVYAGAVLALTAVLAALDLTGANASRPGDQQGLELFLGVAFLMVLGSVVYAVSPAPRRVEVRAESVVVVGRWGRRRSFPPLGSLGIQVVRHFPPGPLTPYPVDVVRVTDARDRIATYEVESGLLDPDGVRE